MEYDTSKLDHDFTPTHIKVEGPFENDRNGCYADLYKAIIREAYGVKDVIIGHHLVYEVEDKRADEFTYTFVQEIPSADALIFDHEVAKKIWGCDWLRILQDLASTPTIDRDALLAHYWEMRKAILD